MSSVNSIETTEDLFLTDKLLIRLRISARFLLGNIPCLRVIRSHHGTLTFEYGFLEQCEILASLVDARGY